jgi:O-antigen/teichoic acid export membrane protein
MNDPGSSRQLFRRLLTSTGLYGIAIIAQRLASIVLIPVNTRFLSPSDFGILDLIEQTGMLASVLLGANFSQALSYFYFQQKTAEDRDNVVATTLAGSLVLTAAGSALAALAALQFGAWLAPDPRLPAYLACSLGLLPIYAVLEGLFAWTRAVDRPSLFLTGSLLRLATSVITTIALVALFHWGVLGVLASSAIASLLVVTILGTVWWRQAAGRRIRREWIRPMLAFALPTGLGWIALFVINFGDRFLLPQYRPLSELGLYALSYKIGMLVSVVHGTFHTYWYTQSYSILKRDDARPVFARLVTHLLVVLLWVALTLSVGAHSVLRVLSQPAFHGAATLVPLIAFTYVIRAMGDHFRMILLSQGRTGLEAWFLSIGAVICAAGYLVAIPRYGAPGAVVATLVSFLVIGILSIVWAYRFWPYYLETNRIIKAIVIAALLLGVYYLVPVQGPVLWEAAWATALSLAYPVLLWVAAFPSPAERELVSRYWTLARQKLAGQA